MDIISLSGLTDECTVSCRPCDFHTHTTYSDGANTAEEMIVAATEAGLTAIGISDHSYTPFDESYCMKAGVLDAYRAEISALKEKYRAKIKVLCGVEQDYYSGSIDVLPGIDYAIGSVHYIKAGNHHIPVDEGSDVLLRGAERHFGGDVYAMIEEYYRTAGDVVNMTGASLIGHFDLIAKFNERAPIFDESHPRYIAAWRAAADALLRTGVPFEINTGAVSRGYRGKAYPSPEIRRYIAERGGRFIISSDSHSTEMLKAAVRFNLADI